MIIAIGCDHAGFPLKAAVLKKLQYAGYDVTDYGTHSAESVDYTDFAHRVAGDVQNYKATRGIVLCGSGNGVAITANKYTRVRAALCWSAEIARLARAHNDANVLALPVRFLTEAEALEIVDAFLTTEFEGGRHQRRVDKIAPLA